jgi:alanyl-tRNA synthetase
MVKVVIDKNRRENLRRLHTATHILNYVSREVLGPHVWQNGSNLKEEYGTLDITHYKNLTIDEKREIEKRVNEIIWANKKVSIEVLSRDEAEKRYGFILYQGGAIPRKELRIVKIEDSDIEACGGTHMLSTGGIGCFKLLETSKIQDGVIRLKFVVEKFALREFWKYEDILSETAEVFSTQFENLPKTSQKFFNEWKKLSKEVENLKSKLNDMQINLILNSNENIFNVDTEDMKDLMEIFNKTINKKKSLQIRSNKFVISSPDIEYEGDFKKKLEKGKFILYIL